MHWVARPAFKALNLILGSEVWLTLVAKVCSWISNFPTLECPISGEHQRICRHWLGRFFPGRSNNLRDRRDHQVRIIDFVFLGCLSTDWPLTKCLWPWDKTLYLTLVVANKTYCAISRKPCNPTKHNMKQFIALHSDSGWIKSMKCNELQWTF